jgi:putative ABC transport system substrate-binding protein
MKVVGLFMNLAETDQHMPLRKQAFLAGLKGFTEGKDVQLEYKYGAGQHQNYPKIAKDLVALNPDVLFCGCGPSWTELSIALQDAARDIPIVFAGMIDPRRVGRLSTRPNDNVGGFISYETSLCETWPVKLKQMAPKLTRIAVTRDRDRQLGPAQFAAIAAVAPSLGLTVTPINLTDTDAAVEAAIASFARAPNSGLIVPGSTLAATRRDFIIGLAAKYRLPAMYPNHMYTTSGGLMSYGAKTLKLYEMGAGYVASLLSGGDSSKLTVVRNSDFELVINLKPAKAMGLEVPQTLLDQADEVLE